MRTINPQKSEKLRIIAYGFDALGFHLPSSGVTVGNNAEIEFLSFQSNGVLDDADGAIIPQGIFETIPGGHNWPVFRWPPGDFM